MALAINQLAIHGCDAGGFSLGQGQFEGKITSVDGCFLWEF